MPRIAVVNHIWEEFNDMANWTPESGTWTVTTAGRVSQTSTTLAVENALRYSGPTSFPNNYTIEANFRFRALNGTTADAQEAGVLLRASGFPASRNDYDISMMLSGLSQADTGKVIVYNHVNGVRTKLAEALVAGGVNLNTYYRLRIEMYDEGTGTRFRVYVNNVLHINFLEATRSHQSGAVYAQTWAGLVDFDYVHQWSYMSAPTTLPFHDSFPLIDPTIWQTELGDWNY